MTTALALAQGGLDTILVGAHSQSDNRTTALFGGSITALETLGVWDTCVAQAAPLRTLRLVDDTDRLLRVPEIRFEAAEIGRSEFGFNIENRHLLAALRQRAAAEPNLARINEDAETFTIGDDSVRITLTSGRTIDAPLLVGADGSRSPSRAAAGIEMTRWSYPQAALTFNLAHRRPHEDISTEFHTEQGPFAVVPLPGLRSSVVCVADPAEGRALAALSDDALSEEAERRMHSILGRVTVEPGRGFFPLNGETARVFGQNRVALVGEAAHRFPPIGAQGLNLSLRDAATIAELAAAACRRGEDPGSAALLARYERMRRADVVSRTAAVDVLNRTLLSDLLPVQAVRGLGAFMLNRVGPLRRAVMREGIMPMASQPRLMRGEALTH
jgi:2-octaprenyl-6-methoxyphenol hydroxylase